MKRLIISVFLVFLCCIPATTHSQMFSLWADEQMNSCVVYTDCDSSTFYSIYVFLDPGPEGVYAAEYKIRQIENHTLVSVENPLIEVDMGTYYGPPGISMGLNSCQNDLFVLCRMDMVALLPRSKDHISILPNDDTGKLIIATCEHPLRPEVDAMVYNYLGINESCAGKAPPSWLKGAEAVMRDRVLAVFDYGVWIRDDTPYPFDDHFIVYSLEEPHDTIRVIGGEWNDDFQYYPAYPDSCLLVLERCMLGGRQYMLRANDICLGGMDFEYVCADSKFEFTCPVIETQLQLFSIESYAGTVTIEWRLSSIDPGTVFHISRRSSDGPFAIVGEIENTERELSYRFEDRSISGGKTYAYRVEYVSDTDHGILFETNAVETRPIPVTLAQNHPNPFNPTTTIVFYIPGTEHVSLQVFDVNGRLVRTLVDGSSEPGSHSVIWDGLDESGNSASSGVYFLKLSAEKIRISKKMILLR